MTPDDERRSGPARRPGPDSRPDPDDDPRIRDTHNAAWNIVSYLLSGMLVWGGVGWLLDRWAGREVLFFPIGVIVGVVAALYLVHVRYDRPQSKSENDLPDRS
jgi:ATP synthase protein I